MKEFKNIKNNKHLSFFGLIIAFSIFIALPNYIRIPFSGISDTIKYSIHFIILTISLVGILFIISIKKSVFSILGSITIFLFTIGAFLLYFLNITITSEIIEVILKTDWSVSKEFISLQLIILIIVSIATTYIIIKYRYRIPSFSFKTKLITLILSIILLIPAIYFNTKRQGTIIKRYPYSYISAGKEYAKTVKASKQKRNIIANDATYTGSDSLLVIFIIGESTRSDHLAFNGYNRNTTPNLSKQQLYSFRYNRSLYTYTAASVPQILTRADSLHPERAFNEESLINIYKRTGFNTIWFANQIPDYTYASLAKRCDTYLNLCATKNTYSDAVSTDQNILDSIDYYINTAPTKKLLILHTIGSHWYYNYRCPESKRIFFPITKSRSYANNSKQQMINSYDNTIIFMDYFINSVISKVKDKSCIIVYTSDHGESLGENGKWLHAFEQAPLHKAACFIWMSNKYKETHCISKNIENNTNKASNTSDIFHTLLQAGDIKSKIIDYNSSLLSDQYSSK